VGRFVSDWPHTTSILQQVSYNGKTPFGEMTFGELTIVGKMTICELKFGEMTFGEATVRELPSAK